MPLHSKIGLISFMKDEEAALPHWGWVKQFTERVSHYGVRIEVREANKVFNEPAPDYLAARMTRHVCFGAFVALVVLRAFGRFEWHEESLLSPGV